MKQIYTSLLLIFLLVTRITVVAQSWKKLFDRADSLNYRGQVNTAYTAYLQAEKQAEIEFGKASYYTAQTMLMLGSVLVQKGEYTSAEKKLKDTRDLLDLIAPDSVERVEVANYLGIVYRNQGHYNRADSLIREALYLSASLKPTAYKKYRAYTLSNLAALYRAMREARRAEPLLIEALSVQESLTGKINQEYASYLSSLASVYNSLEQYEQSEPLHLEALSIYRQLFGDVHPRVAIVMNNLAIRYLDLGDFNQALSLIQKAQIIREQTGAKGRDYLLAMQNIAVCLEAKKQFSRADSLYKKVLTLLSEQGNKTRIDYINTLQNRARLLQKIGRYRDACQLYDEAIMLAEQTLNTESDLYEILLNNASIGYLLFENTAKADSLNNEALKITERVLGQNTVSYAVYLFNKGRIQCTPMNTKMGITLMEEALDRILISFKRNFLTMSTYQKEAFVSKWKGQYQQYFSTIMNVNLPNNSYDVVLSLKNMLLSEQTQVAFALGQTDNKLLKNQLDSLRRVKDIIANLYTKPISQRHNLDSLEARAEMLEKDIARQSATFRQAQQSLKIRCEDIRDALKPNEAAVEFVSFPYHNGYRQTDSVRYMALVLRPGDKAPQLVPLLTDEEPLRQLLAHRRGRASGAALYATRGSEIDNDQLARGDSLYQLIWQPIDRLLNGAKTVYLSPSGLLHQVSFAALPYRSKSSKNTYFLADRYQLRQVGSTRQVVTQRGSDETYRSLKSARLYGGIQYDSVGVAPGSWGFLPGTQREAEQIGQFVGPKATVITGLAATETSLKRLSGQSPTVLHIATHGFAFSDPAVSPNDSNMSASGTVFRRIANPLLRTGLLMAGSNRVWQGGKPALGEDDGILTAYEVANLNLSATRLVVLSACETAIGDIRGSEGVFGLQRAFKIAGVDYLLMSLWPVSDQATSDLMTQFYRNWKKYKILRKAFYHTQSQMRHKYPPDVWAAFVLIE